MATTALVPINFSGLEVRNVLAELLTSDPVSPTEGRFWYRTDLHQLRYYNGSTVQILLTEAFTQTIHDALDHSAVAGTFRLDEVAAPNADISMASHKITSVTDPTSAQDAATKAYVDAAAVGIDWKASVRVATTAAGTLATSFANGQTVDGVVLATGDRILIKDQAAGATNGIYVVAASGAPARSTDADTSAEVTSGMAVFVEEGTTNADTAWVLTTNAPIVLATTALVYTQFTSLGQITAGAGMTKTGSTLDVIASTGITVNADSIQTNHSVIPQLFAQDVGDGVSTTIAVPHNLGTRDVVVEVFRNSTPWDSVICDVERSSTNNVNLKFASAPTAAQFRVVVHG